MVPDRGATKLELIGQDDSQEFKELRLTVGIKKSDVDIAGPPVITISAENLSNVDQKVRANNSPPAPALKSVEDNPRIVLIPTGNPSIDPNPVPVRSDCWQLATPVGEILSYNTGKISPNDTLMQDFSVWGGVNNQTPCLPKGEFTFQGEYEYSVGGEQSKIEWGFRILLK